jgi:bifunctional polynucleotide phosphatase/kinase
MDGTIIQPKGGRTFPRDRHDWEWLYPSVPDKLKALHADGHKIVLFTNQNGISTGRQAREDIQGKILDIQQLLGFPFQAFASLQSDYNRKPQPGMWHTFTVNHNQGVAVNYAASYYIGDAAGRPKGWDGNPRTKKDFSDGIMMFITPHHLRPHFFPIPHRLYQYINNE